MIGEITWDTTRGIYRCTDNICVSIQPRPSSTVMLKALLEDRDPTGLISEEHSQTLNLSFSLLPIAADSSEMQGLVVTLREVGASGANDQPSLVIYGALNSRGQVIFRDVPEGRYQAVLTGLRSVSDPTHLAPAHITQLRQQALAYAKAKPSPLVLPLPTQQVALSAAAASSERGWSSRYLNAAATLQTTLSERDTGDIEVHFRSGTKQGDSAFVVFAWSTSESTSEESVAAVADGEILFAPLQWSDPFHSSVAELRLERLSAPFRIWLPDALLPLDSLFSESVEVVQASVRKAGSAHTQQTWQRISQAKQLPSNLRRAIQEALKQK